MRASLLLRTGLVGLVAAAAMATTGWADTAISINPGNVPTTASGFANHNCDPNQGGGPFAGQDVWVFVLPGEHDTNGDFVSVTADFGANGTVTITSAGNPGDFDNGGPEAAKAWITTPAGWTLVGATATITGSADFFNLTHTCPASSSPSPSPSNPTPSSPVPSSPVPSSPVPSSPTPSSSISASTSTATSPAASGSTGAIPSGGVAAGGGGGKPSGSLVWGLVALILAAGGGVALVLVRRRRDNA